MSGPRRDPATGLWGFVVDLGPGPNAKGEWKERRQARRRGFATKREAEEAYAKLRVSARQHEYVAPSTQTVADFLREWLAAVEPELEATTWESYERNVRLHVTPRIGRLRLQQLDPGALNGLYAELLKEGRTDGKGGLSARSVRYIATVVSAALKAAVEWGRLARNPAGAANPPSPRKAKARAMRTWDAPTMRRFLDLEREDRYWTSWVFLATTGCRRGDALGLVWPDVDLDEGRAVLRQTITVIKGRIHRSVTNKSDRSRLVDLDPATVAALKAWRKRQAEERLLIGAGYRDERLVFCHPDGRPHNPNAFSRAFDRRVARHKLPRIRLHDLRHTWASLALQAGVDVKVVSERLGHASASITWDIYQHVTPKMQSDAAERVAGLFLDGGA